jgi:hypothetical protein
MQTLYYSLMRNLLAFLLFAGAAASLPAQNSSPPPAAMHAAIVDSHEGVTIGVDPWTQSSRYKEKFPKQSPLSGGVVAIRVSFHNGNDKSIKVDLRSIRLLVQFSEDSRQELVPLSAEDVADAVLLKENDKDPTARRNPLPIPIGKTRPSRDANWINLRDACQNAAVPTSVVAAHTSVEGLIYFGLRGEVELLQISRLYIPNLVTMGDNQPLSYFDIDLGQNSSN